MIKLVLLRHGQSVWNLENKSEKKISEKDILGDNEEEDDSIYESNLKKKKT